jgi:hypothetical protein
MRILRWLIPCPAKEGAIKPINARFYAREIRVLVFHQKETYAPKLSDGPT